MTKSIPLTRGRIALIDDVDFDRVSRHKWYCMKNGYAATNIGEKKIYLHRFILSPNSGEHIDHKNMDKLDCRRENIRICSPKQNSYNRGMLATNTSGYKGVTWDKDNMKWIAHIMFNKKTINLGRFKNPKDAAKAYDAKARELFGEFAVLNL